MHGRESLEPQASHRLRHAVEVRHESFVDLAFAALLRKYRIAWVVADTPRPWPLFEDVTADFVYMRLHGATELYQSRYTSEQLDRRADCIRAWAAGKKPADARLIAKDPPPPRASRNVYCYFDNTDKLHAPNNAAELMFKPGLRDSPVIEDHWNPGRTGPSLQLPTCMLNIAMRYWIIAA